MGPNPVVKVPLFWKKNLANGIKMIGTSNTEIPVFTMSVSIPGGHLAQADDTSKVGLANITAAMLNEDTKNYSAEQIALELQKLGSNISVSNDLDNITFTVQGLKKNLDKTLALLEEKLLHPNFTEEAFDRLQKQAIESFKQYKSQPASIATAVYAKLNAGPNNIWGMRENGTEYTVKNLKLKDVQNYYDNYISSQGTKVVVVGDVTENEIVAKLSFLNKLPNKKIQLPKVVKVPDINKTRIYIVDVPKAAQTEFRIGYITGLKYDATGDYYRAGLMNYTLGGGFNSRLNMNLREEKGWTYGARSSFTGNEYNGDYTFSSGIRANATDSALSDILKDMNHYASGGITADELLFTQNAIGQRDALQYETPNQKAGFIKRILDYNLPGNFVQTQNKILTGITKKEIDALAAKWLTTGKMNILLVGDREKILPGIQKMGYEIIDLDVDGNKIDLHVK